MSITRAAVAAVLALLTWSEGAAVAQITLNPIPTRVIGQNSVTITSLNPNLVEGREFLNPSGIAIDTNANPPALYVADTGNNRILGFRNAQSLATGQKADIVIGQPDFVTAVPQGPGRTSLTTGLTSPTGMTVDAHGNLYVVDSANHRVLRFPQPFSQPGQPLPDMVIGQSSFSAGSANKGGTAPSASSLSFLVPNSSGATSIAASSVAVDPAGNLWVADPGNNRVLRFNAATLATGAPSGPSADIVFGQNDFVTATYNQPTTSDPLLSITAIDQPKQIVFDTSGNLYVEESTGTRRGRILVWTSQLFTGQPATRLLAVDEATPQPPLISNLQLGISPGGLFQAGSGIGVNDSTNNRILIFPALSTWTPGTTDQPAIAVAGQTSFNVGSLNQGLPQPNGSTLSFPAAAVILNSQLFVADSGNARVIIMPETLPGPIFAAATTVLGQDALNLNSANLIEGREFNFDGNSGAVDAGITVDLGSNPPHLYVADTYNNRVLGYRDLRTLQAGQKADLVIGQPDFQHSEVNYPSNNPQTPNASGLFAPTGLVVDPAGNLYVADTGNSRVLRFPAPFSNITPGAGEQADLVLGQLNFTTTITDTTQRTLAAPYGLALTINPGLLVADAAQNRVLFFQGASSNFENGIPATLVFGQSDFNSGGAGSGQAQLSGPRHISTDLEDRLYVADTGNARVSIWNTVPGSVSGTPASQIITDNLSSPRGIFVSHVTGDIWVADATTNNATRYAPYNQLQTNGLAPNATIQDISPRAVAEDAWGDLFLADAANRVVVFYPGLGPANAASYLYPHFLAPGMITALFSQGNKNQFGSEAASAPAYQFPLPTQLNGVEVLLNHTAVPLFYAGTDQINFFVPNGAPQSGGYDLQVVEVATGRTMGDTIVQMSPAIPGLFSLTGDGMGTLAAVNKDGTINGPTNPAVQGDAIQIFGTGVGFVPNAPTDGNPAKDATPAQNVPTVIVGFNILTSDQILYSGLAPGLVGVWQLNVTIPMSTITTPTNPTYVEVLVNSNPSGGPALGRAVQIYVRAPK